jgi:predicted site-specific integrase-resolvase
MQFSVNNKAGFFVNKLHLEQKDITLDEIRKAFEDTSDEAEQIVNSITQYSAKLRGSRPY